MRVAVLGLWHLGTVTAACAAGAGHEVRAWDPDRAAMSALDDGKPPVAEPGLAELMQAETAAGRLRFVATAADAVGDADVVWITFDTPVDDEDRADVEHVLRQVCAVFPHLKDGAIVLSSSQLPVGSVRALAEAFDQQAAGRRVSFACSPENLRLGKALDVFRHPDRVVIGCRTAEDRRRLTELFAPITDRLEFMSVESAEMTKHAVNAFLATSVAFINEIAALCERVGADAKEVERGLKTEARIGPKAYLGPGAAFAGGTLARDVVFLRELGRRVERPTALMDGVESSNRAHREWALRRLEQELGSLKGRAVAIWGLTYKPGTDTLRRSTAIELCRALTVRGARVRVHDPSAERLPADLTAVERAGTPLEAVSGAEALVVATEWPQYREIAPDALAAAFAPGLVLDANGFLRALRGDARFRVISVGAAEAVPS